MKAKRIAEIAADIIKLEEQISQLSTELDIEHGATGAAATVAEAIIAREVAKVAMLRAELSAVVQTPVKQGHIHAESMAQYAEDAKTHAEPWKLWECKVHNGKWVPAGPYIHWLRHVEFRRKTKQSCNVATEITIEQDPHPFDGKRAVNRRLTVKLENGVEVVYMVKDAAN